MKNATAKTHQDATGQKPQAKKRSGGNKTAPATTPPILSGREAVQALAGTSKVGPKTSAPKAPATPKAPKADGKMSGLDAAAKVLAEAGTPLRCKDIVEQMLAKGYWTTSGKTPAATIYSAILREIDTKPKDSRFAKTDRGLFALAPAKG